MGSFKSKLRSWKCVIASLLCFWGSLFCYVAYININVDKDDEIGSILFDDVASFTINDAREMELNQLHTSKSQEIDSISGDIAIPNMLIMSPPTQSNVSIFKTICPFRSNICIKNKHWITSNQTDIFDARPSIRYCKGIVCKSFYAEYDGHILNECKMYNNISIVMLGQYYPHMFGHIWSRTLNGLWEYSIRLQFISRNHHFVFEQLDYHNLYMFHQLLIKPFSHHTIQHYKNLLLDPMVALKQMNIDNNDYDVEKDQSKIEDNCICVSEAYFCGFNNDFTKNYPQGFVTRTHPKDGDHYTWDRVEWLKQYWWENWINMNVMENNRKIGKSKFIEEYFEIDTIKDDKPIIGLIDKRKNSKWLNIENVEKLCASQQKKYHCKIIRMYEIERAIELIWIMSKIDILIGFNSNSIVEGGLWLPHRSSIIEILPANPLPSWLNLPGSVLQWVFRKIPQRHGWFQLYEHENRHSEDFNAGKSHFNFSFIELNKVIQFVMQHRNKFCYNHDHNMSLPLELENRNFTFDIKQFDIDGVLYQYKPECGV